MTTHVYALKDPRNDKVRYVGVTREPLWRRLSNHISEKEKTHKSCWIKSLLNDGVRPTIELLADVDNSLRSEAEIGWIKFFRQIGADLVNSTDGGEGSPNPSEETRKKISNGSMGNKNALGHKVSDESRKRMGDFHRGKSLPKETREKIGNAHRGTHRSEETKANISKANKGHKVSDESRKRMSKSHTGVKLSEEHRKRIGDGHLGHEVSETTRRLISDANTGRIISKEAREKN